jgi:SAM-dependent methyltransferase
MLGLARANVRSLTEEARKRVHLVKADMARFRFKRQFGLAIIADNSFRELKTRRQLRQCLRSIRRHLRPEGKLLITERRFRPELYPNGVRSFGWSELKPHPNSRDLVRRRGFIRLHRNGKRVSGVFIYEVIHPDETTTTVRCPILAPVLDLREYLALFSETGYRTEAFHDYEMKPATGDGTMLCFVCSPAKHAN